MSRTRHPKTNQYKADNERFLEAKAQEEGVTVLDSGVIMQRVAEGRGQIHPKTGSLVYVRYTGRLIDGTQFDSTAGATLPALFKVRDLIIASL